MLDLRRLRILHELRSRGTLAAVGHALSLTPSAVSQQLAHLQREAGVPLVEQAGRHVRLTAAGEVLADHAEALLARVDQAENDLAAYAGLVAGTLRVAAFPTGIIGLVVPALRLLARRHPALRLEVVDDETAHVLRRLAIGEVDLVLADEYEYLPRPRDRRLIQQLLLREPVRLALPRNHPLAATEKPISLADLSSEIWAAGTPGTSHADLVAWAGNQLGGFQPDIRHRSDDLTVLLALVGAGQAVALLPDLVDSARDPAIAVREIVEGTLARLVLAWMRRSSAVHPGVRAVLESLREIAQRVAGPGCAPPAAVDSGGRTG
jgi:DNA-binding transcriptional LysR family regulator